MSLLYASAFNGFRCVCVCVCVRARVCVCAHSSLGLDGKQTVWSKQMEVWRNSAPAALASYTDETHTSSAFTWTDPRKDAACMQYASNAEISHKTTESTFLTEINQKRRSGMQ